MTPESILVKSSRGHEEIDTRAHKLGSRLRQVLIRVDGTKSAEALCEEAGAMGDTVWAQLDELLKAGFLLDATPIDEGPTTLPPAPAAKTTVREQAPSPAHAPVKPAAPAKPAAPPPAAVEFNSPVKFKLQDLLMQAVGAETGRLGQALGSCRNREDLVRWVNAVVAPIEAQSGKSKAKAFHKAARQLVGS